MCSPDKVPFSRRRKEFTPEFCILGGIKIADEPDGEIQPPKRERLFNANADRLDIFPRNNSHEFVEERYVFGSAPVETKDSTDLGLHRKEAIDDVRISKSDEFQYEFGYFDMCVGLASIIIFFADVGTDIHLVVKYFKEGKLPYGIVSLILTAGPSIVTCGLGFHWYLLDYKKEQYALNDPSSLKKKHKREQLLKYKTSNCLWALRFLMTLLQLGPVFRISEYLYYGMMSAWPADAKNEKEKSRYHTKMLFEDVDACLLRLFESFLESAPQLTYQLYIWIILKTEEDGDVVGWYIRVFSLLISWLSLAVSLVAYHRSLRFSRYEKKKMSIIAIPSYFVWRASEVGVRVLCICLFASSFHAIVFIPLGLHWAFVAVWLMCQRTTFYTNPCLEKSFNVICGYVMIFCFLNFKEGHTRFRYLVFYAVFYAENISMLVVWFVHSSAVGEVVHVGGLSAVLTLAGLHIVAQLTYYGCFHPTDGIEPCLECDRNTCYGMVCHDLEDTRRKKDPRDFEIKVPKNVYRASDVPEPEYL